MPPDVEPPPDFTHADVGFVYATSMELAPFRKLHRSGVRTQFIK